MWDRECGSESEEEEEMEEPLGPSGPAEGNKDSEVLDPSLKRWVNNSRRTGCPEEKESLAQPSLSYEFCAYFVVDLYCGRWFCPYRNTFNIRKTAVSSPIMAFHSF